VKSGTPSTHWLEDNSQSSSSMAMSAVSGWSTTVGSADVRTTLNNLDSATTPLSRMGIVTVLVDIPALKVTLVDT